MTESTGAQSTPNSLIPPPCMDIKSNNGRAWADVMLSFVHGNRLEYLQAVRRYNRTCIPPKERKSA